MKSPVLLPSLLLFLNACMPASEHTVESNIEKYQTIWSAILLDREMDQFNTDNFSPDVVMHAEPEDVIGIEGMRDHYAAYHIGFPGFEFRILDIFGQGDKLVKHWHFRGTHSGEFLGIPATGRVVELEGITIVEMKNGRIVSERAFMDKLSMFAQLGVVADPRELEVVDRMYKSFAAGKISEAPATMSCDFIRHEAEVNHYSKIALHEKPNKRTKGEKKSKTTDARVAHLCAMSKETNTPFQQSTDGKQVLKAQKQ